MCDTPRYLCLVWIIMMQHHHYSSTVLRMRTHHLSAEPDSGGGGGEDEDIDGSELTVDRDLSTRMGVGHYLITVLTV